MIMQLVHVTSLRDYWAVRKVTYCPEIAKLFTIRRFEAILRNLHFADNENERPVSADGREKPPHERTPAEKNWHVQRLMDLLQDAWCRAVALVQDLSMDESGIKNKSKRDGRVQRNVAKPARYFLKVFGLAAGATVPALRGYLYRATVYGGKGDVRVEWEEGAARSPPRYLLPQWGEPRAQRAV
jgi:hypothetical protein